MVSRRFVIALPALACCEGWLGGFAALPVTGARRTAVIFSSLLEPCTEAVEGMRLRLPGDDASLAVLDLARPTFAADMAQEVTRKPAVLVAVGSDALRAVLGRTYAAITVSTMILEADHPVTSQHGQVRAAVYLDIPIRTQVTELRRLFPERARIGVIRNPSRGDPTAAQIHAQSSETNALQVVDCATPDELLPAFLSLRKKVDFVICLPDGGLYNGATARPLIMASLENRLPIAGFSPAFLRAGAAVAVYPDYKAVGQQTADLVRRCLGEGDCAGGESPRRLKVGVNAKVLRMLGIEFAAADHPELVIVR